MATPADIAATLARQMANPATGWSVGSFGAIAEFMRDAGEPAAVEAADGVLSAVTGRGGIRLSPGAGLRLFASEGATRESWNQRVALCLPEQDCAMNRRAVLTELGPDAGAIRDSDRRGILFDLGLDTHQVDACIRVPETAAAELRPFCGRPVFEAGNAAMTSILAINPHRVFVSRAGRAEVFQPIPPPHGKSPEGPHTHVLPKLLKHRRTHAATEAAPHGFVPCAHFYPPNPVKNAMGESRPYDARDHRAFETLLEAFGDPEFVALKRRVVAAVTAAGDPLAFAVPDDRFARVAIRVALRQFAALNGGSPNLAAWQAVHDPRQHDDLESEAIGQ